MKDTIYIPFLPELQNVYQWNYEHVFCKYDQNVISCQLLL